MNATDEAFQRAVDVAKDNIDSTPREVSNILGYKREGTLRRYLTEAGEREVWDKLKTNEKSDNSPTKNKVEIEHEGNKVEITSRSDRIKTLKQLIDKANINLDKWEIERHVINKWDGQLKGGNPVPLWQVKAWLEKKVLTEKEFEPAKPISLDFDYSHPENPETKALNTGVLIPDPHIGYRRDSYSREMKPFHDRRCLDIDLQLVNEIDPELIVILGDFLDMPNWSKKFTRSPEFANILQASVKEGHWWLRNMREIAPDAKIKYIQGNHECFDEETEILTEDGFKSIDNLDEKEKVGTFNKSTEEIEYQRPVNQVIENYQGKMYKIDGHYTDLKITPNHRLYVKKQATNENWRMEKIKDMHIGQNRLYMKASGAGNQFDEYDITDDEIRAVAWALTDSYIDIPPRSSNYYKVEFYQRESNVSLITDLFDRLDWDYNLTIRNRDITKVAGKVLKQKPENGGVVSLHAGEGKDRLLSLIDSDKDTLPNWIYTLSNRQFDIFLEIFIEADGSRHKSAPETSLMIYGSKSLMDQLQQACLLHGYRTSISEYRKEQYRLNITKNNQLCLSNLKNHIKKMNYSGKIWDLTVPNDTLVVRRNDKISITGNSRLTRFQKNNVKAAYGVKSATATKDDPDLLSVPNLLDLPSLQIEWVGDYPDGGHWINNNLVAEHGSTVSSVSGKSAGKVLDDARESHVFGHTHRVESATKTAYPKNGPKEYRAMSLGCQVYLDNQGTPTPGKKKKQDWQNAVGVVEYESGNGYFSIHPLLIYNGQMIYNGKKYKGNTRLNDLVEQANLEKYNFVDNN